MWPGVNELSKWSIEAVGSGYYRFVNLVTEYVMEVGGGATYDGANVSQYA